MARTTDLQACSCHDVSFVGVLGFSTASSQVFLYYLGVSLFSRILYWKIGRVHFFYVVFGNVTAGSDDGSCPWRTISEHDHGTEYLGL